MFSLKHILLLCVCIVYISVALYFLFKNKPTMHEVMRWLFLIGIVSETLKVFTYIVLNEEKYGGYLPKTDLPFHLCSIQIIFMIICLVSKNENVQRVLIAFMYPTCLIGGIAALLLPTSSSMSNNVIMVQYFLYHSSIVVFAIYVSNCDEVRFNFKDYCNALIMLFAAFFVAIYLNSWVNDYQNNINFMYVVNPPVEGLPFLNKDKGWLVYILRYWALALSSVTLCYIRPIIAKFRNLKKD